MKKIILLLSVFLFSAGVVLAQDEAVLDENVTAVDLGIEEPTLLPDSPFYFLKEWQRGIGNFFTFNSVKKTERYLEQANEKLIEAQKIAEKTGNEEIAVKAMEKYQKAVEKTGNRIEKIKEKQKDNPDYQVLLDKYTEDGFNQHRVMSVLQNRFREIPKEAQNRIEGVREAVSVKLGEVLEAVDGEKMDERINRVTVRIEGGDLKQIKNLEVLKELESKLPESALPAILRAQENATERLKEKIEAIPVNEREERLSDYMETVSGNETRHLEILEDLKSRSDVSSGMKIMIESVEAKPLIRIKSRIEDLEGDIAYDKYLEHLKDGSVERLNILNKIENKLSPAGMERIRILKESAIDNIGTKIEGTSVPAEAEVLIQKINSNWGVRQEILKIKPSILISPTDVRGETGGSPSDCPVYASVAPAVKDDCIAKGGQMESYKDSKGCWGSPSCVFPVCAKIGERVYDMSSKGPISCCIGLVLKKCIGVCTPSILGTCEQQLCAQVITPARNQDGICKTFSNTCLPSGWKKDVSCGKKDIPTTGIIPISPIKEPTVSQ